MMCTVQQNANFLILCRSFLLHGCIVTTKVWKAPILQNNNPITSPFPGTPQRINKGTKIGSSLGRMYLFADIPVE